MDTVLLTKAPARPHKRHNLIKRMNRNELTTGQVVTAYAVAIIADLLQLPLSLMKLSGILTVPIEALDVFLDCMVMFILWGCLGFHWLLLPTMAGESIPGCELLPTWTGSVALLVKIRRDEAAAYAESQQGFSPNAADQDGEQLQLPPTPETGVTDRLSNAKYLYDEGLITEEEYEMKRREILAEL